MQYIYNIYIFSDKNPNHFFISFLHKETKVNGRQTKDRNVHMCMCVRSVCVCDDCRTNLWLAIAICCKI